MKTKATVWAKISHEQGKQKWVKGKSYGLLCTPTGFTIDSDTGKQDYTYMEMDSVLRNFKVPAVHML